VSRIGEGQFSSLQKVLSRKRFVARFVLAALCVAFLLQCESCSQTVAPAKPIRIKVVVNAGSIAGKTPVTPRANSSFRWSGTPRPGSSTDGRLFRE
jgi:hypothetical protein